jgi:Protein of unknown function (DUF2815)
MKFKGADFKTPRCTAAFTNSLFEPRAITEGGPLKFGVTLIFDNEHRAFFDGKLHEAVTGEWDERGMAMLKSGRIKSPLLDGNGEQARNKTTEQLYAGFGEGRFFIRAQANVDRPPVLRYRDPNVPASKEEIYSGCACKAVLNAFSWQHPTGGLGVSFGLRMLQRIGGGDNIGGGGPVDPNKWMDPVDEDDDFLDQGMTVNGGGKGVEDIF